MAIMHYQFEAIHPFTDGNGRTGRILNVLYLIEKKLLDLPILYLSRYIIQTKSDYYRLLQEVTSKENWEEWLTYILQGVAETSLWTTAKIRAIRDLKQKAAEFVKTEEPQIYSHELVEKIFEQPYCRISDLVDAGLAQRQTASTYLRKLVAAGVLVELKVGREKIFVHPALRRLLTSDVNTLDAYRSPKIIGSRHSRGKDL